MATQFEKIDLPSVVKFGDSSTWYKKEVSGQLLLKGDKYTHFKEGAIKCVIGSGEDKIVIMIHGHDMVNVIADLPTEKKFGLSISNFQKKDGSLKASKFSVVELLTDVKDVPEYSSSKEVPLSCLYAPIMSYKNIQQSRQNTMVSLKGNLYKYYAKIGNRPPKVEVKDDNGQIMKVVLWDYYGDQLEAAETGQEIFFYDMLTNHEREKDYLGYALSAVKSSSSTKITLGDEARDIPNISIQDVKNIIGNKEIHARIEGTIVATSPIYKYQGKEYAKVVIADGEDGILVFIEKPDLLPSLNNDVVNKAKLEITIFQKENNYITTDKCRNIEVDTENLPEVFKTDWEVLLHTEVVENFDVLHQMGSNKIVSLKGTICQIDTNDEHRTTLMLHDNTGTNVSVSLLDDKKVAPGTLVCGDEIVVYDVSLKPTHDASAVIIVSSSSATELKKIASTEMCEIQGTLTGFNGEYIYVRQTNGNKKHLRASLEVRSQVPKLITCPVLVNVEGQTAVTIAKRKLNM